MHVNTSTILNIVNHQKKKKDKKTKPNVLASKQTNDSML